MNQMHLHCLVIPTSNHNRWPLVSFCLVFAVSSLIGGIEAGNYSSLTDAIPQLNNLTKNIKTSHPISLGGRNITHCCLLAVNQTFEIQNGSLTQTEHNNTSLDSRFSIFDFENAVENGQFPCGASYNGDRDGAPIIDVSYDWCKDNCGGWELSDSTKLREWIGPMVGFILPSLVFCLNIPRRRKIHIGDRWFKAKPSRTLDFLKTPLLAFVAAILVSTDTLIWLCICFAAAGPMILSGIYEAFLDSRILAVLEKSLTSRAWTTEMRARLLLLVLVGNFDMRDCNAGKSTTENDARDQAGKNLSTSKTEVGRDPLQPTRPQRLPATSGLREHRWESIGDIPTSRSSYNTNSGLIRKSPEITSRTTWSDVDKIIQKIGSDPYGEYNLQIRLAQVNAAQERTRAHQKLAETIRNLQSTYETIDVKEATKDAEDENEASLILIQQELDQTIATQKLALDEGIVKHDRALGRVKTRLRTMLAAQSSFGSTIGAPVVFFIGGFIFNIADTMTVLGQNDTSHALAFGMWWMMIPYVAIVAGLLLGANNPSSLEGIVGKECPPKSPYMKIFALAYPSTYKTEWTWFRGRSKRQWIEGILNQFEQTNDLEELRRKTRFTAKIWSYIIGITVALIIIPFILAYLTSYFTPIIGISCRSFTFLAYAVLQIS